MPALRPRTYRLLAALLGLVLGGLLSFYLGNRVTVGQGASNHTLATFTQNDVTVQISLQTLAGGQHWLVGTFTPLRPHFHLYSKDLPRLGLRGQGRPTLMEIAPTPGLTLLGDLLDSAPTFDHYNRAIEQALPVYPEGPVTLRQRLSLPAGTASISVQISITYMACSQDICLSPVVDQPLIVQLNKSS